MRFASHSLATSRVLYAVLRHVSVSSGLSKIQAREQIRQMETFDVEFALLIV